MLRVERLGDGLEERGLLGKAVHEAPISRDAYLGIGRTVEAEVLQFGHALSVSKLIR